MSLATAVSVDGATLARLREVVARVRQAQRIVPGITRDVGNRELGAQAQMFENLLYSPEADRSGMVDFFWRQVLENPSLADSMIRVGEGYAAISHKEVSQ